MEVLEAELDYRETLNLTRFRNVTKNEQGLKVALKAAFREISEKFRQAIISTLNDMAYDGEYKLAISTIRKKGHDTVLLDTGGLRQSLIIKRDKLTIKSGQGNYPLTFRSMWEVHEYGNDKIPPRPAWKISWDKLTSGNPSYVDKVIQKHVTNYFLNKVENALR
jgi:hypothetical protein